jgi:oligopeptidase A
LEFDPERSNPVQNTLDEVRKQTSLIKVPSYNRFQNSFAHIFSGGYAAGYYSYTWAEVLSCDAYGKFAENGVLSRETGEAFMQNILEKGGACDPLDAFVAFRGHKPELDALLKQNGWI